ncbi:MAG: porin [Bacteroidetes bacterium]|nr:porin [Bacteroidota bacterium]
MKNIITIIIAMMSINSFAQTAISEEDKKAIVQQVKKELLDSLNNKQEIKTDKLKDFSISGYIEPYYSYDFGNPNDHNRVGFNYSHQRHNEININLAFLKVAYQTENVRANLALAAGTYMNANYAAEPGVLKNLYEANAGVKISKKKNLWIDAGIMSSHIGFESAIGKDNWTVTRGIYAENSPYFETGVKMTYTTNDDKWTLSALVLNGWQRIQRINGNHLPAFGHQLIYKPNSKITLNSSSFIGSDKPDSTRQMRYFHNLYGIFQISNKFALTTGFDIGAEQKSKGSSQYNVWFTPVVIAKISPTDKINLAFRGEYFNDKKEVILATGNPNGFQTWGYSVNFDYSIRENVVWRIEGRGFSSKDKIFTLNNHPSNHNFFITTALAIAF